MKKPPVDYLGDIRRTHLRPSLAGPLALSLMNWLEAFTDIPLGWVPERNRYGTLADFLESALTEE